MIGNWFGKGGRGLFLGVWSACASIGNIIGSYLAAAILPFGYEYTFLVNAGLLFAGGIVVFFGLVSHPRDIGLPDAEENLDEKEHEGEVSERPKAVGVCRAILLRGVIAYSLAYACLKLVNYSFFFRLPFYLNNNYGWAETEADSLSTFYDWGGIAGGIVGGFITDFMPTRTPVVVVMLLGATGSLYGYKGLANDVVLSQVVMTIAGFLIGGPANLISAAISADLGKQPDIRGNAEALATVTGLVDGTGSVGAGLGQILLPIVQEKWGWNNVFVMFIIMIFLTVVCLIDPLVRDVRDWVRSCRERRLAAGGDGDDVGRIIGATDSSVSGSNETEK